jgi:hypothetical protein
MGDTRTPRPLSNAGRALVAEAVQIRHDWDLPFSSVDMLIDALGPLGDDDLEAAHLLASHLREATCCLLIRRETARDEARRRGQPSESAS